MLSFYLKGLLRDRSRSLMPIIVVAIGVALVVLIQCWITGVLGDMIDFNANFSTGHVKIMSRTYYENIDQLPNDLALLESDELLGKIKDQYPGMMWVERIQFGGLVDAPDENGETKEQGPGGGMAVDLLSGKSGEAERLNLERSLVRGALPAGSFEILLSDDFARKLDVQVGDPVTLIGSTMFGAMSITNFTVCGTVRFGSAVLDRGGIIADISGIRSAFDMTGATGEILGFFPDGYYDDEAAGKLSSEFNETYSDPQDEYAPVMVPLREQNNLTGYLDLVGYMKSFIIIIFVIAMSIVLWNSGLLGGLRRYGEMGLRLAIGEEKPHIYRSLITEAVFIGLAGSVAGTAIGLLFSYWMTKGIDISGMLSNSTMMMQGVMKAEIVPAAYYIGFIPGVLATVLGTALAGIGIYKRQTAQLFKELQV
ncbi:MAG: FtsX-like permease family protein [Bacteroidales bacterium]|nr:FtsX-like permease family protein [Bacteroidales bacterium]HDS07701.1 FtsX-like permease family protein [Bacteroides sp.]